MVAVATLSFSIRPYDERHDAQRVDDVEKLCEAGPSGSMSLFTDLLGDPLCRLRHFPAYSMMVAEVDTGVGMEIVGMIRAGIKQVVCGRPSAPQSEQTGAELEKSGPITTVAYILGLRVAPPYRRLGIGVELAKQMEAWCKEHGAQYTYIATEKDNEASVNLFVHKLGYSKFRTPAILVQPVYASSRRIHSSVRVAELSRQRAEALYRETFKDREFFPRDIEAILRSNVHKGTWVAAFKEGGKRDRAHEQQAADSDEIASLISSSAASTSSSDCSWAVLSVWKCNEIFKLEVKGAPFRTRRAVAAARLIGKLFRKMGAIPTPPNVFKPFGLQLLYGIHCHGQRGHDLVKELCWFAHNMARRDGCAVVAAEVGACDPLRDSIPHWASLSCDEDLWCIKRLTPWQPSACTTTTTTHIAGDWITSPPPSSLFVDPRDF